MTIKLNDYMPQIEDLVERTLDEDLSSGDATTDPLIPPHTHGRASFIAKATGVLAGVEIARLAFLKIDPFLRFITLVAHFSQTVLSLP